MAPPSEPVTNHPALALPASDTKGVTTLDNRCVGHLMLGAPIQPLAQCSRFHHSIPAYVLIYLGGWLQIRSPHLSLPDGCPA